MSSALALDASARDCPTALPVTHDTRWLRAIAGPSFRRADAVRDERADVDESPLERFLVDLSGWRPVMTVRAAAIRELAAAIDEQAQDLANRPDVEVAARFASLANGLKTGPLSLSDSIGLASLFACIGEAARRRLGLTPHPVQWAGARLLLKGQLAEMRTGEGKTLVAAIAALAMAGTGANVHVISSNDYLSKRDSEEMSPFFAFFGLGCAYVQGGMEPEARRSAYSKPICYVSSKEVVFDYLKDKLAGHGHTAMKVTELRQLWDLGRPIPAAPLIPALHFAIVDEADNVLIDEARTPMILSRDAAGLFESELLNWAIDAARQLELDTHYRLDGQRKSVHLQAGALEACGQVPDGVRAVWRSDAWRRMIIQQALSALHLYRRDQHYIVQDGKVQIVDESTGRVMADRSWEQGLHQLIETKEGLEATSSRETLARMTFQRFFRRYFVVSGLTGTAAEDSRELWTVYRLRTFRVPPHRSDRRQRLTSIFVARGTQKWPRVADEAVRAARRGQPVLVGTRSVQASEQVSTEFQRRGIEHVVLNARQDAHEAMIVAQAGTSGRITVATNMAGRGTDIKLDANARGAGGLYVILTEFHESARVDRQLFGRCGRQGEAGLTRAIVAGDDVLLLGLSPWTALVLSRLRGWVQSVVLHALVRSAQARAGREAYRARMQTLKQDRDLHRIIGFAGQIK